MAYRYKSYQPALPFQCPVKLLTPTTKKVNGVNQKEFEETDLIYCSFRTFGGTERTVNDVFVIENTAVAETYYRPDIKNDCVLQLPDESKWEILHIENIEMKNTFLRIEVKNLNGAA